MSENPLPKLAVSIAPPHHGWIDIEILYGDDRLRDTMSYAWPDSVLRLIEIIVGLAQGRHDEMMVSFSIEPGMYEWFFTPQEDEIILRVDHYPNDMHHVASQRRVILEAHDDREHLCMTFWRAFRKLQSQITPEEYLSHWHYAFPSRQIDTLTTLIKER